MKIFTKSQIKKYQYLNQKLEILAISDSLFDYQWLFNNEHSYYYGDEIPSNFLDDMDFNNIYRFILDDNHYFIINGFILTTTEVLGMFNPNYFYIFDIVVNKPSYYLDVTSNNLLYIYNKLFLDYQIPIVNVKLSDVNITSFYQDSIIDETKFNVFLNVINNEDSSIIPIHDLEQIGIVFSDLDKIDPNVYERYQTLSEPKIWEKTKSLLTETL
jgi:hypothetical protein